MPPRTSLTFDNGFYVDVTVLFIDMRGSKAYQDKHNRPVLAKIYRAYISEVIAVMRGDVKVSEIYIEGDGLWGVFNTTTHAEVNQVFSTAAKLSSLIDMLNIKLESKGYTDLPPTGVPIKSGSPG